MRLFIPPESASGTLPSLQGFTLVVPSVSIGNVGQLAIDLFVATLEPQLAAIVEDDNLLPAVGLDAYTPAGTGALALPAELRVHAASKCAFLQLRSATAPGRSAAWAASLAAWAKSQGFGSVLVLGSTPADARRDAVIDAGTRLAIVSALPDDHARMEATRKLGLPQMGGDVLEEVKTYQSKLAPWTYLSALESDAPELEVVTLLAFAAEGDNTQEAVQMASYAHAYLTLCEGADEPAGQMTWKPPPSWAAVYGRPVPSDIY